jgi:hypothetical protein
VPEEVDFGAATLLTIPPYVIFYQAQVGLVSGREAVTLD